MICPDRAHLQRHLEGALKPEEQVDLIAHLDTCQTCQHTLEELATVGEPLASMVRKVCQEPPVSGPALRAALDEAKAEEGNGETVSEAERSEPVALDFLSPSDKPGHLGRLGHYDVMEIVGQGGMGVVLKAHDEKLQRVVAIKVMAPRLATSATARKRFIREAQAAAAIRNEHVIGIHAVEEANGLPYLVMEYISGLSLQERLKRNGPLELKEILRIGMQTAAGLAAAHAQGLIHRDIKPANILLENGVERVKITDFGLARAVDDTSLTQSGVVAGTPDFMSPEQARGEAVGPRADLFSLGTLLYVMCTGRKPFRASGTMAVLKRVCDDTPRPIPEINPEIPDWLVHIIAKLHAKEPAQRFQTAAEVAELLGRHLAHLQQPGAVPHWYHRRHAGATNVHEADAHPRSAGSAIGSTGVTPVPLRRPWLYAGAALLLVVGGLGLSEATGVTEVSHFIATVLRFSTPEGTLIVEVDDPSVRVTVEGDGGVIITGAGPQEVRLRPGSYRLQASKDGTVLRNELVTITRGDRQVVKVTLESAAQSSPSPLDQLDPARIPPERRWAGQPKELVAVLAAHEKAVMGLAFSPDGKLLATSSDAVVRLWDMSTGELKSTLKGHNDWVSPVAFSPDGKLLASGGDWKDKTIKLWDVTAAKELATLEGHSGGVISLAFSPDSRMLASGNATAGGVGMVPKDIPNEIRLWDVATRQERAVLHGHGDFVTTLAFSPDGNTLLSNGMWDLTVRFWDVAMQKQTLRLDFNWVIFAAAFSPNGQTLAVALESVATRQAAVKLLDVATLKERGTLAHEAHGHIRLAFSANGEMLAVAGDDGRLLLWNPASGRKLREWQLPNKILGVAFAPDSRHLAAAHENGRVSVLRLTSAKTEK